MKTRTTINPREAANPAKNSLVNPPTALNGDKLGQLYPTTQKKSRKTPSLATVKRRVQNTSPRQNNHHKQNTRMHRARL
ncbi:hypothetical protein PYJP_07230 [Pyrofollis japonicus]|nr:hypothetical protein PYJP_07230 [Pyrofollis japonicus]